MRRRGYIVVPAYPDFAWPSTAGADKVSAAPANAARRVSMVGRILIVPSPDGAEARQREE